MVYGGLQYSIGKRDSGEVEQEIAEALASGTPHWLDVNYGEGAPRAARLLITPGVEISLIPIDPDVAPEEYPADAYESSIGHPDSL